MKVQIYQNNRNEHKFIELHVYSCHHWSWRQFMYSPQVGYIEYTGGRGKSIQTGRGLLGRIRKHTIDEVLGEDYHLVAG